MQINLVAGQVSEILSVAPGTRITSTGGTVEYVPGVLTDAKNGSGTWKTVPISTGHVDVVRQICIRATGPTTLTIEEGKVDDRPDGIYFDSEFATYATDSSGNVTGLVGPDGSVLIRPVTAYTWALKPAAADNTGITIRISDVGGSAGSLWISDGAYWKPVGGRVTLGGSGEGVTGALDTVENSFASFVLPGYAMGPNGCLNIVTTWSYTNSANNKVLRIRFGTMAGERLVDSTQSTSASIRMWTEWQNRNRVDQQAGGTAQSNSLLAGGIGGAAFTSTQDTTVNNTIFITGQKATGAESLILMRWIAELIVP